MRHEHDSLVRGLLDEEVSPLEEAGDMLDYVEHLLSEDRMDEAEHFAREARSLVEKAKRRQTKQKRAKDKSVAATKAGAEKQHKAAVAKARKQKKKKPTQKPAGASARSTSHDPFQYKRKLGPGPRGRTVKATDKWDCDCPEPYGCLCQNRDTGAVRKIDIDRGWKKAYNKEYKAWRKKKGK